MTDFSTWCRSGAATCNRTGNLISSLVKSPLFSPLAHRDRGARRNQKLVGKETTLVKRPSKFLGIAMRLTFTTHRFFVRTDNLVSRGDYSNFT